MSTWAQKLLALAEAVDRAQRQRRRSVLFLSKPYTYSAAEGAACLTCDLPADRIRVGEPERNPIGFDEFPIPVSFEPCGHRVSITVEEADPVWSRLEQPSDDTGRRCPRCDCPDNAPQCDHCKVCPHVEEGQPEPPSDEELNAALPVRPDARQPAYDAVYEYIRALGDYLPPDPAHRNAVIWRAVNAALGATPVGRCVSSHCVEGDHILDLGEAP